MLPWPDPASDRGRPVDRPPHGRVRGKVVQAHSTWLHEQLSAFGATGGITDLTVPGVRLGLAPGVYRLCAWPTLRRVRRGGRIAELEFAARWPRCGASSRRACGPGDSGALHAALFGDGSAPKREDATICASGHQAPRLLRRGVAQHSIAPPADVARSVDFARLIDARGHPRCACSALNVLKRSTSSIMALKARLVTGPPRRSLSGTSGEPSPHCSCEATSCIRTARFVRIDCAAGDLTYTGR